MKRFVFLTMLLLNIQFTEAIGLRDMVILLDWNNETVDLKKLQTGWGSIGGSMVTGLILKSYPMIFSSASWKNFVQRREVFEDFSTKSIEVLKKKYSPQFASEQSLQDFEIICKKAIGPNWKQLTLYKQIIALRYTIAWATPFNPDEWNMSKVSEYIYLFIPKNYEKKITANDKRIKDKIEQQNPGTRLECSLNQKQLTKQTLDLGLKFGQPISNADSLDYEKHKGPMDVTINIAQEFLDVLPNIFVTSNDISQNSPSEKSEENITLCLNRWYFYLLGHGDQNVIAQFLPKQFQKLLKFFNNNIKTDFFFYDTCKIGGPHLQQPYQKEWDYPLLSEGLKLALKKPEVFNFMIIASSFIYAKTYTPVPESIFPASKATIPVPVQNFTEFFNTIHQYIYPSLLGPAKTLIQILEFIHPFQGEIKQYASNVELPVVRYPHTEWFSLVDVGKEVLRLNPVFVETKEAEEKNIVVGKEKKVVIIEPSLGQILETVADGNGSNIQHSEILTPIVFEGKEFILLNQFFPTILSSFPFTSYHYFKEINAEQWWFTKIMEGFLRIKEIAHARRYYIKKLRCRNNFDEPLIPNRNEKINLKNVIIFYNDSFPNVFYKQKVLGFQFEYNNKIFHKGLFFTSHSNMITELQKSSPLQVRHVTVNKNIIPFYPFKIKKKSRLKKVSEMLKKKELAAQKEKREVKTSTNPKELSKNLKQLEQGLNQLSQQPTK